MAVSLSDPYPAIKAAAASIRILSCAATSRSQNTSVWEPHKKSHVRRGVLHFQVDITTS